MKLQDRTSQPQVKLHLTELHLNQVREKVIKQQAVDGFISKELHRRRLTPGEGTSKGICSNKLTLVSNMHLPGEAFFSTRSGPPGAGILASVPYMKR